jgi:hypothetical protein
MGGVMVRGGVAGPIGTSDSLFPVRARFEGRSFGVVGAAPRVNGDDLDRR